MVGSWKHIMFSKWHICQCIVVWFQLTLHLKLFRLQFKDHSLQLSVFNPHPSISNKHSITRSWELWGSCPTPMHKTFIHMWLSNSDAQGIHLGLFNPCAQIVCHNVSSSITCSHTYMAKVIYSVHISQSLGHKYIHPKYHQGTITFSHMQ